MHKENLIFRNNFDDIAGFIPSGNDVFMVYDSNAEQYADELAGLIDIKGSMSIEASEEEKTMDTVMDIIRFLLALDADRNALLLAVGGGITTDLAGFAASIYKRGINCAYIPTTLLAQVDAAIGGKTAVNVDGFKNMAGTFSMPLFTYVNSSTLSSLPEREIRCGIAEMLKTFLIEGTEHYSEAVRTISEGRDIGSLAEMAARFKAAVAERDPLEKAERRKLNLGHTFAHAIEWYEHCHNVAAPLSHGEAVAIGIIQAARMENPEFADRIASDFRACGLPTELPYPMEELEPAMHKDKKNKGTTIKFVTIKAPGEVE